jgi:putative NADH-flavin reductase
MTKSLRVLVLGASGSVGREILARGLERGHGLAAQTRSAEKLAAFADRVRIIEASPLNPEAIRGAVRDQDAVIFAVGTDMTGRTTLFSDATKILVQAMREAGVRRLVAITGVGAGGTRRHGGFVYNWIIYPLFTRHRYADKTLQEKLIEASELDWVIVRPAPYSDRIPAGAMQVFSRIERDTVLRRVHRREVAEFVLDQLTDNRYLRRKTLIGHP